MQNTINQVSSYNNDQIVYKNFPVDELPAIISDEICQILNRQSKWKELADKHLQWDQFKVQNVDKQKNPMKEFLRQLGSLGYGANELYCILYKMGHYLGMQVLQVCVDEKYHHLMNKAKDNLSKMPKAKAQCVPTGPNKNNNENNQTNEEKILNSVEKITPRPVAPSNSNNLDVKSPSSPNLIILNPSMTLPEIMTTLKNKTLLQNLSYKVLTDATDNWSNAKIIGKGGFGKVFKGSWKNTDVAIKRLEKNNGKSDDVYMGDFKQYLEEITTMELCKHDCVLPIYAYSLSYDLPSCIVYQIMANGSLEERLAAKNNNKPPLNWLQRHNIAKFVAQGLQFMHSHIENKPLIHGDIKSANILLDANMNPKIGDFGMARRINNKEGEKVDNLHGTKIYLPPDYLNGKILSPKVDTYSYGCVMYELATGLRYDQLKNNDQYKSNPDNNKFYKLDDKKAGNLHNLVFCNLIEVGNKCTQLLPENRPYMDQVYISLVNCE